MESAKKKPDKIASGVRVVLGLVFLLIGNFVGLTVWNWFAPHLFGLPVLTYWQIFAVSLLVGYFVHDPTIVRNENFEEKLAAFAGKWITIIVLGFVMKIVLGI